MIKHFPITDTNKISEYYSQKDGVAVRYICTTDVGDSDNDPADIFYRDTPHPEFGNRYFAMRLRGEQLYISNADQIEELTFGMIEDDDGDLQYSQYRHDYKAFKNGNMIDGGRNYIKSSGQLQTFFIKNGNFYSIDTKELNLNTLLSSYGPFIDLNNVDSKNIEEFWPVHDMYLNEYNRRVSIGKNIAQNSDIGIVSLARNCDKQLLNSINTIINLQSKNFKFFIYENDSEDNTKNILSSITHPNIYVSLNTYYTTDIRDTSLERTTNLAKYRNVCNKWIKHHYSNCDYVIVLDLDADLGFSIDGIYDSIYWLNTIHNAGGMGSYSLHLKYSSSSVEFAHYDSFAVRLNGWEPTINNIDIHNPWFRNLHPFVGSDPIPMYSCFGGLSVYKKDAFLNGVYDGSLGCEHVLFHKSLQDKGYNMYLNPSSRFFSVCKKEI